MKPKAQTPSTQGPRPQLPPPLTPEQRKAMVERAKQFALRREQAAQVKNMDRQPTVSKPAWMVEKQTQPKPEPLIQPPSLVTLPLQQLSSLLSSDPQIQSPLESRVTQNPSEMALRQRQRAEARAGLNGKPEAKTTQPQHAMTAAYKQVQQLARGSFAL
ncbi:MAG TPA: hypothetical protein PLD88_00420, partial [Candidatus Berkiella sp.]|nr:hypothetical protein [Candidatus Berkiella sp.]